MSAVAVTGSDVPEGERDDQEREQHDDRDDAVTDQHQLTGLLGAVLAGEDHQGTPHRRLPLSVLGTPAILARPSRPGAQARTCPSPSTTHVDVVSSARPIGPRACSCCVEIPISAPRPSWPPSVNRVEAFTMIAAESSSVVKRRTAVVSRVRIASVWPEL